VKPLMRTGRYAPGCLVWPPMLVDDTIALKGGVDERYHSYLRQPLPLARLAACIAHKMLQPPFPRRPEPAGSL
jgi:hypothetical protein